MKIDRLKYPLMGLFALLTVAVLGFLLFQSESDVLQRGEELNLFLPTRTYWQMLAIYPGGALSWAACWMTEFLHIPALGISLMAISWLITMGCLYYLGRLRGTWAGLAALVPILLVGCLTQTGYLLYYQKMEGHLLVPTLGMMFAILAATIYHLLPRRWSTNLVWMTIWGIVGYPLMGAWSFIGTLLMMCPRELKREGWILRIAAPIVLGILLIGAVPQICYQQLFTQVNQDTLYRAGLPTLCINQIDLPQYRTTYYLLWISLIPIMLVQLLPLKLRKQWIGLIVCIMLIGGAAYQTNKIWYRDVNFHKEIRMHLAIEQMDWEGALRVMLEPSQTPPTRIMVMYKNIALFRLGRVGDEMFHYPDGGILQNAPWPTHMAQIDGRLLYYEYGKELFCYRWCMECAVEFGWTVEDLMLMSKSSLIDSDWRVAKKYLKLLEGTRYYSEWAHKYETYLYHPEKIKADPEMKFLLELKPKDDHLDTDVTQIEQYILNNYATSQGHEPIFQEMTLICALLNRDIQQFWPHFFEYTSLHRGQHIPIHYQEAAYLYGHLENQVDISHMPFDESVRKSYDDFMEFNQQCGPMTVEQKKSAFYPQFGDTFYYFYFLQRNIQTN